MAWFEGFESGLHPVGDVELFARVGGDRSKPPLLLLHGYPQTHAMWHRVARALAADFRLVVADLRGYGDSTKPMPAPTPELDHAQHSKRSMAADLVALMRSLGHDRFAVAGHDRGGRVAHRLALDHPEQVTRLAVLDIAPTLDMYEATDMRFASRYYHWFFLIQPAPLPERMIGADPGFYLHWTLAAWGGHGLSFIEPEACIAEYERCFCRADADPCRVRGLPRLRHDRPRARPRLARGRREDRLRRRSCCGERAASSAASTIRSPSGARSAPARSRATTIEVPHFLAEELADATAARLAAFLAPQQA